METLRAFGDGRALAHGAINAAIADAHTRGGGMVTLPPGRYLCFSIRLRSGVHLYLSEGAVIEAADPSRHGGAYDLPEDNGEQLYQDFGHSHWCNSLIWAIGATDIAITGTGRIEGRGLTRNGPGSRWRAQAGERPLSMAAMSEDEVGALELNAAAMHGLGNKAIGLRECRGVELAGFTIDGGGHFAILATGCADMVIRGLSIDTERDGIDLDCVSRCLVEHCRVNSPNDDAIVVKSSLALGRPVVSEDITIRHCTVSGFDLGTMLDGTRARTQQFAPDRDKVTGRIKIGTETNGDIRRILIEDCRFERSRGLAIECVDGAVVEHITARRLSMEEVTSAPIFLRLGARLRGPEGAKIGVLRHVEISDVTARGIAHEYPAIVAGLSGHPVQRVVLRNIDLEFIGGGTAADAAQQPAQLPDAYPEPSMFGTLPAWALWMRDVHDVSIEAFHARHAGVDARPPVIMRDVTGLNWPEMPV